MIRTSPPLRDETLQHARNLAVFVPPTRANSLINVFQVRAIFQPDLHLICRTYRHQKIALELQIGLPLLAEAFGKIRTDRFAGSPNLIGKTTKLFDLWKPQRRLMQIERNCVSSSEYVEILDR